MMYGNWWNGMLESGFPLWGVTLLPVLALWSVFWKGLGLWHSGRRGQYWWFVVLLVINTAGILELVYLFAVLRLKFGDLFSMRASVPSERTGGQA